MEFVIMVLSVVAFICMIVGTVVYLLMWLLALGLDQKYGHESLINPNDPDFFPNLYIFKKRVKEIASKDKVTRDYLESRRIRIQKIQNK